MINELNKYCMLDNLLNIKYNCSIKRRTRGVT